MFFEKLQQEINNWRENNYLGVKPETENILRFIKQVGFLHAPQFVALETYIFLKEIKNNQPLQEIFKSFYSTLLKTPCVSWGMKYS